MSDNIKINLSYINLHKYSYKFLKRSVSANPQPAQTICYRQLIFLKPDFLL